VLHADAGALQGVVQGVKRAIEALLDHPLELRAREPDRGVARGDKDRDGHVRVEGQRLLRVDALPAELGEGDPGPLDVQGRPGETRCPEDVAEHRIVEVGTAQRVQVDLPLDRERAALHSA